MEFPDLGVGDPRAEAVLGARKVAVVVKMGICHICVLWVGNTWRKARDDGAMVALVKRHGEEQVRQIGASDPETTMVFSKGAKLGRL